MARRTTTKAAPVEEAPAKKESTTAPEKGTVWLAEHISEVTGKDYTAYQLRILIRKLVKDGVIERGEGRYEFRGPRDPQVVAIVKAVKAGGVEKTRSERLAKVKEDAEEKAPARRRSRSTAKKDEDAAPTTRTRRSRKAAPVEEDDDDDIDLDEI